MKISKIEFKHFRSFYGNSELNISLDPEKNVTLIIAQNGSGKTNILNAIRLCFHNEHTDNFRDPKDIINQQALSEGISTAYVGIWFEQDERSYYAKRQWHASKIGTNKFGDDFSVDDVVNGSHVPNRSPKTLISRIFPVSMSPYFAFDGEGAIKMADKDADKLQISTKDILGTSHIDSAMKDLKTLERSINKKYIETDHTEPLQKISSQIESKEAELDVLDKKQDSHKNDLSKYKDQVYEIEKILRGIDDIKPLIQQENSTKNELEKAKKEITDLRVERINWLNNYFRPILSKRLIDTTEKIISKEEAAGKIPFDISQSLVNRIIHDKECICGTTFDEGSKEATKLEQFKQTAGSVSVHNGITRGTSHLAVLKDRLTNANSLYQEICVNEKEANSRIQAYEAQLLELETQLKKFTIIDGAEEKINKKIQLKKNIEDLNRDIGIYVEKINQCQKELSELKIQQKKLSDQSPVNDTLQAKLNLVRAALAYIERSLVTEEQDAREVIQEKMNNLFKASKRKNFKCQIQTNWKINLINSTTEKPIIGPSNGETNLLSLVYVSALLEFCKERKNDDQPHLINGTSATLTLDSPFSDLDDWYDKIAAEFIPIMNEQVILLLSSKQINTVKNELKDKIGSAYVARMYVDSQFEENPENSIQKDIMIYDQRLNLLVENSEFAYTKFEEFSV